MANALRLRLQRRRRHGLHEGHRWRPGRDALQDAHGDARRCREARVPTGRVRKTRRQGERKIRPWRPLRGGVVPDVPRAMQSATQPDLPLPAEEEPFALRVSHQPWGGRVSRGRVSGDVRTRGAKLARLAGGDLPDKRHHPPRRERSRGRREHQADFDRSEGGERDHNVHGRRPQRQVPHLRAWDGAGNREAANRIVQPLDTHCRPRGGLSPPRVRRDRRILGAHLGGDRLRRAKDVGDALRRGGRALPAPLVRRVGRARCFRRALEHRPHAAHHSHPRRSRGSASGRDLAVRQRAGVRGERD
mmetsp:Transcript_32276/g.89143  ORF Transcript_32276/g.89143 Transcript_32276/m.89143 type:complete len:303 (+) Transcript_32276:799-1707(+)